MAADLSATKVAILATDGFEQSELFEPLHALREAGATVEIVAPQRGEIRGWNRTDWGESVAVDRSLEEASAADYDGLVLPGGQINPDKLRIDARAVRFVREMHDAQKTIGAICHAPWLLIEAGVVEGREMTSYASVSTDLMNAGATWVDAEVVIDEGIVTSRAPGDLPAFCERVIEQLAEGPHAQRGRPGSPWLRRPIRPEAEEEGVTPHAGDERS